jgi:hypothetical protein
MATPAQIEASRENGRKSRGPTTAAGLLRSSMNAYKHGRRSKKRALLQEDSYGFETRSQKWTARNDPRDDVEEFLSDHIVVMSLELDRAKRAHLENLRSLVENSDERAVDDVYELGRRLFFHPCGPTALYGFAPYDCKQKTSWDRQLGGEFDPDTLVRTLAKNAPGCLFMREEWTELRALLAPGKCWQPSHRLKATRLLRRQPVDALVDRDVALIFIASLDPDAEKTRAFSELVSDVKRGGLNRFRGRVRTAWPELFVAGNSVNYREMLIELVDAQIERWDEEFAAHEENADEEVKGEIDRLGIDRSKEGTLVREYYQKCWRLFQRGVANYEKLKGRDAPKKRGGDWSKEPELDWARQPYPGSDISERKSRLAWADASPNGSAGAAVPETLAANGDGKLTNESEVDEAVINTECHDPDDVMAKSDVDAGLENGVIEAVHERESVPVSEPTSALMCDIGDVVPSDLEVERVEFGDRPPLGQRIGPQIEDPTLGDITIHGGNLTNEPGGGMALASSGHH